MHELIHGTLAVSRTRELIEAARLPQARTSRRPAPQAPVPAVTIRFANAHDAARLAALSSLDDRRGRLLRGNLTVADTATLVAEQDGAVVAALPLDGTPAYADPFRPTSAVVSLLEARAAQIERSMAPRRGLLPAITRPLRRLA